MAERNNAKARYGELELLREPYLRRARQCSRFTIPSLIPPDGWTGTQDLPEPWNNLGARGVNNLSSKLLLALFPPGSACFRNAIDPKTVTDLEAKLGKDSPELAKFLGEVDSAMADIEKRFVTWTEEAQTRPSLGESFKHLIVGGNSLLHFPGTGGVRVFRLDKFVVLRDPYGKVLEVIVKESVSRAALPEHVEELLEEAGPSGKAEGGDLPSGNDDLNSKAVAKTVHLYTHVYWDERHYRVYQEVVGKVVPGSQGSYPADKLPWLPLRWTKIDGEDYGWGHVDSFVGDLTTLDMLSQALSEGSAAAARVIYLKKPGSVGKTKDLAEAPNGGFVAMDHDAVKALTLEKYADFRVALERVASLEKDTAFSFLLNTAIQRNGERVTAEEIRYMAQELEDALGGVYSIFSQELQLPYVRLMLAQMSKAKAIPTLPKDIKPIIITGLEALGRGNDLNRLDAFMQGVAQTFGPEVLAQYMNVDEYLRRRGVALSVDPKGLVKTPQEIAQAQQAAQMQEMIKQMGPQAVSAMGNVAGKNVDAQSKKDIESAKQQQAAGQG